MYRIPTVHYPRLQSSSSDQSGHPFSKAHSIISSCPPPSASSSVSKSQGHPRSRHHFNADRCTPPASQRHVFGPQGKFLVLAHFIVSRSPACAARVHKSPCHGQLLAIAHRRRSSLPISIDFVHKAVVRPKPHSKLYDNRDTDVEGDKAFVSVGRFPQTCFHPLHTNAKNKSSVSSTNAAMCEMMSTFSAMALLLVQPSRSEINLKAICWGRGIAEIYFSPQFLRS